MWSASVSIFTKSGMKEGKYELEDECEWMLQTRIKTYIVYTVCNLFLMLIYDF